MDVMPADTGGFWRSAVKYTAARQDGPFVNEMAYMLVTLHRTGS